MKIFVIALALAALFPGPADSPLSRETASVAPRPSAAAEQQEARSSEPPAWVLALTGILAIALMRRPRR